jgi:hypothetical protein
MQRIRQVMDGLGYNFEGFELSDFVNHLCIIRRRDIHIFPFPFEPELFGLWIPAERADYIFYNQAVHHIHKVHIILHEIAHMLLDHSCRDIRTILPVELLVELKVGRPTGHMRTASKLSVRDDAEEREAEEFVFLIQQQVVYANRMSELTRDSSSIRAIRPFTDGLAFNG